MARILVIDDEADLRTLLRRALERDGHQVTELAEGKAVTEAHCRMADCVLLDVMMPEEDGFETCRRIRKLTDGPILFLTAKTEEADILRGLGLGADDYLMKPFRIAELRARVAAHLRRENRQPVHRLRRDRLEFDLGAKKAYLEGVLLQFTKGEYAICELLASRAGQTFSREQIYEAVFGYDSEAEESAVTEHVKNIRAKLRPYGCTPVETVWGIGYRWKREEEE